MKPWLLRYKSFQQWFGLVLVLSFCSPTNYSADRSVLAPGSFVEIDRIAPLLEIYKIDPRLDWPPQLLEEIHRYYFFDKGENTERLQSIEMLALQGGMAFRVAEAFNGFILSWPNGYNLLFGVSGASLPVELLATDSKNEQVQFETLKGLQLIGVALWRDLQWPLEPARSLDTILEEWVLSEELLPGEFLGAQFPKAVGITGVGARFPSKKLTNADLVGEGVRVLTAVKQRLDFLGETYRDDRQFNDPYDFEKKGTGILSRYWFDAEKDLPSKMGAQALTEALAQAGYPVDKITAKLKPYLIGVSSYGAELLSPRVGPLVNSHLGLRFPFPCLSADAVCPGWVAAVVDLLPKVATGMAGVGLIPVVEYYSRHLRLDSGSSWPIFGDMAVATVLAPVETGGGILWGLYQTDGKSFFIEAKSKGEPIGEVNLSEIIQTPHDGFFEMHGQAVGFMATLTGSFMVRRMVHILRQQKWGKEVNDVDWYVFHQANKGLILKLADTLGIDRSKLLFTIEEFGNTSAASIPLTLHQHQHRFKKGELLFMGSFGGGFQWGALLMRWSANTPFPTPISATSLIEEAV